MIEVMCDICEKIRYLLYCWYLKGVKNGGFYSCGKCKHIKIKSTKKEKYGNENYVNSNKNKLTCLEKYGDKNYRNINKNKQTCLEKYGCENVFQNEEVKEKMKETNIEKYGFENPSKNCRCKEKVSITKKEKYGDSNYNNMEKNEKTCIERYGVKYPMQNNDVYSKSLKNSFKMKNHELSNLYYQSSYEKHFLDNYYEKLKIVRGFQIKFVYKDKKTIYYPDYYLPEYNLIVEIKSDYFYKKSLELNLEKKYQCEISGYDFIFIINKNYELLNNLIKN